MRKQKAMNSQAKQYAYLKRRIAKAQRKAKFVGVLYLLGTLAISALCCLSLITVNGATLGATAFWKPFAKLKFNASEIKANIFPLLIAVFYGLMLLIMLSCVLKSLRSLKWLFKKKASKLYGFNRNAYAMDDLGRYFSRAFASALIFHFLIVIVAGGIKGVSMLAYALVGVGLVLHLFCGLVGGKVSLFSTDGELYEEKREVGRFSVFVRNVIQIALTAVAIYLFVENNAIKGAIENATTNGFTALTKDTPSLIVLALQVLVAIWLIAMIGYATGNKEFDPDGKETAGRKSYLWLSFFLFVTACAWYVYGQTIAKMTIDNEVVILAGVAFVGLIMEILLRNFPKTKNKRVATDEVETGVFLKENYDKVGIYFPDEN